MILLDLEPQQGIEPNHPEVMGVFHRQLTRLVNCDLVDHNGNRTPTCAKPDILENTGIYHCTVLPLH